MKSNPGGTVTGSAIVGRHKELREIWNKLQKRSIVLSAERRVGTTSILRKMKEIPKDNWTPLLVLVESARHPIDCVEAIYNEADAAHLRSSKSQWAKSLRDAYRALAATEISGWRLPAIQNDWRRMLKLLVQDIAENSPAGAVIMIDEFPLMVWNISDDHGASLAMQFLDGLREVRQQFEPTGKIRFVFSGSIGFHLVLQHLKLDHGYKGAPTNDTHPILLTGMEPGDVETMCKLYLDEERIERRTPAEVADRLHFRTDGLPLYIQYVCEALQDERAAFATAQDVDRILDQMLNERRVGWFKDAAQRIEGYYAKLHCDRPAAIILNHLSRHEDLRDEAEILSAVQTRDATIDESLLRNVLELLLDDNYLVRDTSTGTRRYRFRYRLMRQW